MKKILGIVLVLIAMVIIAGCSEKTSATADIIDVRIGQSSIVLSVTINDPDEEITGLITVKVLHTGGIVIESKEIQDEAELADIFFFDLDNTFEHTIEVHATIGRESVIIGESTHQLLATEKVSITTPQEFLDMKMNRAGDFVLENDLDFSGIEFSSIFTSPFSGTFDGQGFTIRNIDFSEIAVYTGVFGFVSSGTIENLVLENINIGTVEEPLVMATSSRVGILAGYISSATAVVENVTIKNSVISYTTSSTIMAFVGAVVGEFRAEMKDVEVDQVDIHLTSTSHAKINIGGVIGLLTETASLNRVKTNASINFTMAGVELKNQEVVINIGGVIGKHSATLKNNAVQDILSTGNITVNLDFGTAPNTDDAYYVVYVGGVVGLANRNITNALFGGSILLNHTRNENEDEVNKTFAVGGLIGYYGSTRVIEQAVRINNGQTIEINVDDAEEILSYSQTIGDSFSTVEHSIGIFGDLHLMVNGSSATAGDESYIFDSLVDFFTSDWMTEAYEELID